MTRAIAGFLAAVMLGACAMGVSAQNDTHGRNASPDYARVFNQDRIGRIELRIAASDWQALIADMQDMAGQFGGQIGGSNPPGGGAGGPGGGLPAPSPDAVAACVGRIEGDACSFGTPSATGRCTQTQNGGPLACVALGGVPGGGGGLPGGGGNVGGGARDDVELLPRNPIYVPADVTFDGETFRHVGFRLKGNSSLVNTWRSGSDKLPFRLNIDGLEARFPEIRDQTFFGFPNLSFSNNSLDTSYLRAKVVTDLFREAGLPAPRTAFMQVYLDRGSGLSYLGLYTMVEVPDDPFLDVMFGSSGGNLYKPHSTGGRWTVFDKDDFPKKTNEFDEDWTDIQGAIAALNASRIDPASWRQRLEARFDVNAFLRWLALNTIVGNSDAYGGLSAHNYYLYGSPRHRDRLFWIPWDHDLAMSTGGIGGAAGGPGGGAPGANVDVFHTGIGAPWPLIRFFMDDAVYRAMYRAHVENLLATVFQPSSLSARFQSEHARIASFVIGASGELAGRSFAGTPEQFDATVFGPTGLIAYVESRAAAVRRALGATP